MAHKQRGFWVQYGAQAKGTFPSRVSQPGRGWVGASGSVGDVLSQQSCSDTAARLRAKTSLVGQGRSPLPAWDEKADFSKRITKKSRTIKAGARCYLFLKEMFVLTLADDFQ